MRIRSWHFAALRNWRRTGTLLCLAAALQGCATTSTAPAPAARIEIQEDVGFTITEEARASGNVRTGYDEAVQLLERGELERGIAVLENIVAESPQLGAPLIDLGIALHRSGDLEGAEKRLGQALAVTPDHPIVHNELGIIYRKTGRFDAARRSYEQALAVFPGYHFARRNLAVLCDLYLGDLACALDNYQAYMTTVPADDEVSMWIADLNMRLEQEARP